MKAAVKFRTRTFYLSRHKPYSLNCHVFYYTCIVTTKKAMSKKNNIRVLKFGSDSVKAKKRVPKSRLYNSLPLHSLPIPIHQSLIIVQSLDKGSPLTKVLTSRSLNYEATILKAENGLNQICLSFIWKPRLPQNFALWSTSDSIISDISETDKVIKFKVRQL